MTDENAKVEGVREAILVLNVLVVLQPVACEELETQLSGQVRDNGVTEIIANLANGGKVRQLPDKRYIVTRAGLTMFGGSGLTRRRDILRMLHLADRSKRG